MLKLNHLTGFGSGAAAAVAGAAGDVTSYAFDGTGDYLSIPDHADWNLTGDHTIECFIRLPDVSAHDDMIYAQVLDGNNRRHLSITSDGTINYYCKESSTFLFQVYTGAGEISDNTWYHVAVVRDGDDYYMYVDGVSKSVSGSPDSSNPSGIAAPLRIGTYAAATEWLGGYIDELRVSDTCRYPDGTTFAPTTTQFVSDANTKLLIHGGEAYTGALTGETTQSCVTLDGVNDYLTVPDHADWSFGAGDFTIDFLIKFNDKTNAMFIMSQDLDGSTNYWYISKSSDASGSKLKIKFRASSVTLAQYTMTGNWSVSDNTWYHIAFVRSTTSILLFIDGVSEALTEDTAVSTNDVGNIAAVLSIGVLGSTGTGDVDGMFSELRISDTARWTSGFTPSTTRYTSDANTVLLIHGDENGGGTAAFTDSGNTGHTVTPTGNAFLGNGGTFTDSGNTGHTVSENGQAQKETEQEFKFADDGVGYYFDGTGDYLSVPDHADFDFGSDNFTVEYWLKFANLTPGAAGIHISQGNYRGAYLPYFGGSSPNITMAYYLSTGSGWDIASGTTGGTISDTNWHHIAISRSGSNIRLFLDGVNETTITSAASIYYASEGLSIGCWWSTDSIEGAADGYFDEIRISDTARYTTGFTPSSTQFTSDANTLLLIHGGETKSGTTGSGATFTDSGDTGHTVTENGNAIESTGNLYKF